MSSIKPIIVYGEFITPNPHKIRIILDELNIPYEDDVVEVREVKGERFINVNPNGRLPAIHDPNTGVTLWESAAITSYLIDQYDKERRLSYASSPEKYEIQQWIAFQVSGQGPYYGQAVHFSGFHPIKFPTAIDRYDKEIDRVRSVLNLHLTKKAAAAGPSATETWLVGDKLTVADLSWVMWEHIADFLFRLKGSDINPPGKYPAYEAWASRLYARPACKKAIERRAAGFRKEGMIVAKFMRKDFLELEGAKAEMSTWEPAE